MANELMAHVYSHLYRLPTTGLRFFTVYGPWGRPRMSYFLFTKAILERQPIDVFNHGRMVRDFTYIDDIVEGVVRVLDRDATPSATRDTARPRQVIGTLAASDRTVNGRRSGVVLRHGISLPGPKALLAESACALSPRRTRIAAGDGDARVTARREGAVGAAPDATMSAQPESLLR